MTEHHGCFNLVHYFYIRYEYTFRCEYSLNSGDCCGPRSPFRATIARPSSSCDVFFFPFFSGGHLKHDFSPFRTLIHPRHWQGAAEPTPGHEGSGNGVGRDGRLLQRRGQPRGTGEEKGRRRRNRRRHNQHSRRQSVWQKLVLTVSNSVSLGRVVYVVLYE